MCKGHMDKAKGGRIKGRSGDGEVGGGGEMETTVLKNQ